MKIWNSYGSEHSANLVMIGEFRSVSDAKVAAKSISLIEEAVRNNEAEVCDRDSSEEYHYFPEPILKLFSELRIHSIYPTELDQFRYDFNSDLEGSKVVITTEEVDVSALLKVLIDSGAKVKIFSRHNYPDEAN